jgi:hypothetical protein
METRYWIKQRGPRGLAPEEVADLMFLAKGQRSMIADREIPLIIEQIDDNGHIFEYKPKYGNILSKNNRHGEYIKKIYGDISDAQRSRIADSLFIMHDKEIERVRKKKPSVQKSKIKVKKKIRKK